MAPDFKVVYMQSYRGCVCAWPNAFTGVCEPCFPHMHTVISLATVGSDTRPGDAVCSGNFSPPADTNSKHMAAANSKGSRLSCPGAPCSSLSHKSRKGRRVSLGDWWVRWMGTPPGQQGQGDRRDYFHDVIFYFWKQSCWICILMEVLVR